MTCALGLALAVAASADPASLEQAAAKAAMGGRLPEAEARYVQLLDQGSDSADLWFNLGTVQVESGRPVDGVISLLSGLRRAPGHSDLLHNLGATRELLELGPKPGTTADSWAFRAAGLADQAPFGAWAGLAVVGNGMLAAALFFRSRRAAGPGLLLTGIAALALAGLHHAAQRPWAVALRQVELRAGPAQTSASRLQLSAGQDLTPLKGADAGFRRVRAPDGTEGWVPVGAIEEIAPYRPFF